MAVVALSPVCEGFWRRKRCQKTGGEMGGSSLSEVGEMDFQISRLEHPQQFWKVREECGGHQELAGVH